MVRGEIGTVGVTAARVRETLTGDVASPGGVSSSAISSGKVVAIALAMSRARSGFGSVTAISISTVSSGLLAVTCPARLSAVVVSLRSSITGWSTRGLVTRSV